MEAKKHTVFMEFCQFKNKFFPLRANRHARDQLLRASQSIPQNIAEGNGKRSGPDRRRFFGIARGSALECASVLDILLVCEAITIVEVNTGKGMLHRIVSMLTRMTERPRRDGAVQR